ncbi:MAG: DUF5615 family PIN-like protein [Persicimonas sp.]
MKLLANENVPLGSVQELRDADHDVVSIAETSPGISDPEVLELAALENRVVLTFDRDYGELIFHRNMSTPAGVVYFRFTPQTPHEPAELLRTILGDPQIELMGFFTVIERMAIRQRTIDQDSSDSG